MCLCVVNFLIILVFFGCIFYFQICLIFSPNVDAKRSWCFALCWISKLCKYFLFFLFFLNRSRRKKWKIRWIRTVVSQLKVRISSNYLRRKRSAKIHSLAFLVRPPSRSIHPLNSLFNLFIEKRGAKIRPLPFLVRPSVSPYIYSPELLRFFNVFREKRGAKIQALPFWLALLLSLYPLNCCLFNLFWKPGAKIHCLLFLVLALFLALYIPWTVSLRFICGEERGAKKQNLVLAFLLTLQSPDLSLSFIWRITGCKK